MFLIESAIADASNGFIYPQVSNMGDGYDWKHPTPVTQWDGTAAGSPNLKAVHLDPATQFTDILSQGYLRTPGLLVSARLAHLLEQRALPAHRSWPVEVVLESEHRDYRWLEFSDSTGPALDWQRSNFVVRRDGGAKDTRRFSAAAQLSQCAMALVDRLEGTLWPGKIVLGATEQAWDLFMLKLSTWTVFASDDLAQALRREKMSGLRLTAL